MYTKLIAAILVFLMVFGYNIAWRLSADSQYVTVNSKERVQTQDSSKYLIFAEQGEFEVIDTWLFFDFSASTRYNKLKENHTCKVTTAGWRFGFLSWYPAIVAVDQCKPNAKG